MSAPLAIASCCIASCRHVLCRHVQRVVHGCDRGMSSWLAWHSSAAVPSYLTPGYCGMQVYALRPDRQRAVATETLQVWCSLAERLGMFALKVSFFLPFVPFSVCAFLMLTVFVPALARVADKYH